MDIDRYKNKFYFSILIAILLLGGYFRFSQLNSIPPGLFHDEAYNGIDAINANKTGDYKIFYPANFGREGLYINIISFMFKLFGINVQSLRFTSALFGFLTLIGFYLLLRELRISRFSSLVALFMMSFSFWHLNFSRIAYRGIMVPFLLVWIAYFFYKGIYSKKSVFFIIAGLFLGIGVHTYIPFRIAPFIYIFAIIAYGIFIPGFLKIYWKKLLLFLSAAFSAALPMVIYFFNYPNSFTGRMKAISIFSESTINPFAAFVASFILHFFGFFLTGDPNQRHSHQGNAFIPLIWSVLFAIGLIISFKEIILLIKRKRSKMCDASILGFNMFWLMLIPGILSIRFVPKTLRIIGAIPAVFLLAAIAIEYVASLIDYSKYISLPILHVKIKLKQLILTALALLVMMAGVWQIHLYFNAWAKHPDTAKSFYKQAHDLGLLVKLLPLKHNNFIVFNQQDRQVSSSYFRHAKKTIEFKGYPDSLRYQYLNPDSLSNINCNNSQVIFYNMNDSDSKKIFSLCPNFKSENIRPRDGAYEFLVMK